MLTAGSNNLWCTWHYLWTNISKNC